MPMFDFTCTGCGTVFEELVFGDEAPACPKCGKNTTLARFGGVRGTAVGDAGINPFFP